MYAISDGYNLNPKEVTFLDKLIELNAVPNNRKVSNLVMDAIDNYGSSSDHHSSTQRTIESEHY